MRYLLLPGLVFFLLAITVMGVNIEIERRPVPETLAVPDPAQSPQPGLRDLPPPSRSDPLYTVKIDALRDASGTAFQINRTNFWMTARHVVDGCDRVAILRGRRVERWASQVGTLANADLAFFTARGTRSRQALSLELGVLRKGQSAYGFGFPGGEWTQVHMHLLGRARQRATGRYRFVEPVLVWSIGSTLPQGVDTFGGMSGGPILDEQGALMGVLSSASRRRGRLMTVAPVMLKRALDQYSLPATREAAPFDTANLNATHYPKAGHELREQRQVVRVYCDVS